MTWGVGVVAHTHGMANAGISLLKQDIRDAVMDFITCRVWTDQSRMYGSTDSTKMTSKDDLMEGRRSFSWSHFWNRCPMKDQGSDRTDSLPANHSQGEISGCGDMNNDRGSLAAEEGGKVKDDSSDSSDLFVQKDDFLFEDEGESEVLREEEVHHRAS